MCVNTYQDGGHTHALIKCSRGLNVTLCSRKLLLFLYLGHVCDRSNHDIFFCFVIPVYHCSRFEHCDDSSFNCHWYMEFDRNWIHSIMETRISQVLMSSLSLSLSLSSIPSQGHRCLTVTGHNGCLCSFRNVYFLMHGIRILALLQQSCWVH